MPLGMREYRRWLSVEERNGAATNDEAPRLLPPSRKSRGSWVAHSKPFGLGELAIALICYQSERPMSTVF